MRFVGFDCETYLILPGNPAPRMVCLTTAERGGGEVDTALYDRADGLAWFRAIIVRPDVVLIGANVYYDLGILCAEDPSLVPLVFAAFDAGRIRDAQVRQKLRDIRDGCMKYTIDVDGEITGQRYALADLVWRYLKRDRSHEKKGPDVWRLRYSELDGVALCDWPEPARRYAIQDAIDALLIHEIQYADDEPIEMNGEVIAATGDDTIADELRQTRYQWALHLMSLWGIRTDVEAVDRLEVALRDRAAKLLAEVRHEAPELVTAAGKRCMAPIYQRVDQAYEGNPPRTDTGRPATDRETLEESGDEGLRLVASLVKTTKMLSKDLKDLRRGVTYPINARWNGLVESGRISCSKPNLANPPREGGVRECFVPRPGHVFVDIDLDTIELRGLAQVNLELQGRSDMAEALRAGRDLHADFAADLSGQGYEAFILSLDLGDKEAALVRQFAKIGNFGFPGGMGWRSLVSYAKGYGIEISPEQAKKLHGAYQRKWSEMPGYFAIVKRWLGLEGRGYVVQRRSNRIRGGVTFCKACNSLFQGLVADATKSAFWELQKACYLGPLAPARPVLYLYDQFVVEAPEERAHDIAEGVHKLVMREVQSWMPDVPVSGKPSLTRRFYKGPKPIVINGQLVPSKPVLEGKKLKWVADLAA